MPRRGLPLITYLGTGGMYVYLPHPPVLRPFLAWVGADWVDTRPEQLHAVRRPRLTTRARARPPDPVPDLLVGA